MKKYIWLPVLGMIMASAYGLLSGKALAMWQSDETQEEFHEAVIAQQEFNSQQIELNSNYDEQVARGDERWTSQQENNERTWQAVLALMEKG